MKKIGFLFCLFMSATLSGQVQLSKEEIKQKNDSILAEGNLLYRYEKAAWVSTDLAMSIKEVKDSFGGYLIYQSGDSIKAIILGKELNTCIYELTFLHDFANPYKELLYNRKLNEVEENLQSIKLKIVSEAFTPSYQVQCAERFNLVLELIPYTAGYKLYVLTGTSQHDIIPMGNDYIFFSDENGEITSWRKFHSRLIATQTKINGEKVTGITHSHLRSEPFISATDICTFKLYGNYYGLKQFKVLSTALSKYFTYDADKNTIETADM
jgi:hypothetical protein